MLLKAQNVLVKDTGSVPSTHLVAHNHFLYRGSNTLFCALQAPEHTSIDTVETLSLS